MTGRSFHRLWQMSYHPQKSSKFEQSIQRQRYLYGTSSRRGSLVGSTWPGMSSNNIFPTSQGASAFPPSHRRKISTNPFQSIRLAQDLLNPKINIPESRLPYPMGFFLFTERDLAESPHAFLRRWHMWIVGTYSFYPHVHDAFRTLIVLWLFRRALLFAALDYG